MVLENIKRPHWIILGPENSWETSFDQQGIWGVKNLLYPEWKALDPGDIIFFYITKTIRGVVGVGRVGNKFIQDKPLWPDEISAAKVIYPYRFEINIDYLIERKDWKAKKIKIGLSIQEMRRGINLLKEETIERLYRDIREKLDYTITVNDNRKIEGVILKTDDFEKLSLSHTKLQELIFEIGRLNRYIAEKEYSMENERLDVVWRRVEKSVPTYVFEVQVGGDIYHALGKLKHAYDLWNSKIFLVASKEDLENAEALLLGTFHEIQNKINKITIYKVYELYEQKRRWIDIEKEVGLF